MPKTRRTTTKLEESPLIQRDDAQSTIHPDRLDKTRFTEIKDLDSDGTSPVRIIVYAVIVVIIGVGAAVLVRNLVSNNQVQQNTETPETTNETEEDTVSDGNVVISLTAKPDSNASNLASNSDYIDSSLVSLGDSTLVMTDVSLDKIEYTKYTTFARSRFVFSGNEQKLPKTNISYDSLGNTIQVEFVGLTNIDPDLMEDIELNDIVESITYSAEDDSFTINLSEDSKYRVRSDSGNLIIDIKTVAALEEPESDNTVAEETEEEEEEDTTPTDSSKPAAPHYENAFSKNQQYVSSDVDDDTLGFNNYWIWDEGTFFEFSIGRTDSVGEEFIPNATAYLDTEAGKTYLYFEVENLSTTAFSQDRDKTIQEMIQSSGAQIDANQVNFVMIELVSFEDGKASYRIELKEEADFRLLTQKAYGDKSQIVSIQIKD